VITMLPAGLAVPTCSHSAPAPRPVALYKVGEITRRSFGSRIHVREPQHAGPPGRVPAIFIMVRVIHRQDNQGRTIDAYVRPIGAPDAVVDDAVFSGAR